MKTLFVSSTFKDMQYERDAIHQIVLPRLNAVAKRYGQTLSFCDLRWGINTMELDSDEGSKKVLDVCLDKIDRCGSPMIVLLGDRYGYIPNSSIIKDVASYKRLELEDLEISVTALEIEYGAMSEHQKKNTLFYFREMSGAPMDYLCEDAEHAQKLNLLKNRIVKLAGGKVRKYSIKYSDGMPDSMNEFADMLVSDVTDVLLPEWKEQSHMSTFALERKTQWDFIEDRNAVCRGRKKLLSDVVAKVFDGNRIVALKGDSGSGKSVVFSKLAVMLRDAGWDVLPFVGGLTTESNDAADIVRNIVVYLQAKLNGGDPDAITEECYKLKFGELRSRSEALINQYCEAGDRFIVMVDAVDQLYDDVNRNSLAFIPDVTAQGFCVLVTFNSDFKELNVGSIPVLPLSNDEKEEVISGTLERYERELDKRVIADMVALKNSDNPLYLGFLIKRLLMMYKYDFDIINSRGGHMGAISDYQRELIAECPKTTDELCAVLLEEAGKRINQQLVSKTLKYIACSRFGLRETDLSALLSCEWNPLDFAHFVAYMGDCFIMRDDGRYDFAHKSIRQGLIKMLDVQVENKKILDYLQTVDDNDVLKTEIIYHIMQADDKEFFRTYALKLVNDDCNGDNEQIVNRFVRYITSACEFVGAYGGEWFANVIRSTPVTKEMLPFAVVMISVSLYMSSMLFSPQAVHLINIELKELADRFVEHGIEGGAAMQQSVGFLLGQSYIANNSDDGAAKQFSDVYDMTLASYRRTPTDDMVMGLLVAARSCLFTMSAEERTNGKALDVFNVLEELYETSKAQYASSCSAVTARNLFMCNSTTALLSIMSGEYDDAVAYVAKCKAILLDCLDLFTETMDIRNMLEFNNSCGAIVVGKIEDIVLKQADLMGEDDSYADVNSEDDDYSADINSDDNDYSDILNFEDDDYSNYVNSEVDRLLNQVQAADGNLEETEQSLNELLDFFGEGDEYDDNAQSEKLGEIGIEIFDLSATLAKYAADKLGATAYMAEYSAAFMNTAIIQSHLGKDDVAERLLRIALDELKKAEEDGVTPTTRQIAHKIKSSLLNVESSLGADCEVLLPLARDIARGAENISATDIGAVDVAAQFEANMTVINLLMSKCSASVDDGVEIDEDGISELLYWCDKTEKLTSSPFIDESAKSIFATIKYALEEILCDD